MRALAPIFTALLLALGVTARAEPVSGPLAAATKTTKKKGKKPKKGQTRPPAGDAEEKKDDGAAETPADAPPETATDTRTEGAATASDSATAAPPPTDTSTAAQAPPADAGKTTVEEVTDFEKEEQEIDQRIEQTLGKPPHPSKDAQGDAQGLGFKFIVDLVLQHTIGQKNVSFFPNHTMAILMVSVNDRVSLQMNLDPDPAFYELAFAVTPTFNVKVGKLLLPFGTNNFHHIIGGRVDQESRFLPETWSDYGVAVNHLLVDARWLSLEYDLYVVNGFGGATEPLISVGTVTDNNFAKGLGARVTATFPHGLRLVGSAYHSLWDIDNSKGVLFYALGGAMPPGAIALPVLDRLGLRGEWSRGEIQLLTDNVQVGLTRHAVARAGWYGEALVRLTDDVMLRVRAGRVNGDNTVTDDNDVEVLEPAVIIGSPKLFFLVAWQMTKSPVRAYSISSPPDVLYAKVFLQY